MKIKTNNFITSFENERQLKLIKINKELLDIGLKVEKGYLKTILFSRIVADIRTAKFYVDMINASIIKAAKIYESIMGFEVTIINSSPPTSPPYY